MKTLSKWDMNQPPNNKVGALAYSHPGPTDIHKKRVPKRGNCGWPKHKHNSHPFVFSPFIFSPFVHQAVDGPKPPQPTRNPLHTPTWKRSKCERAALLKRSWPSMWKGGLQSHNKITHTNLHGENRDDTILCFDCVRWDQTNRCGLTWWQEILMCTFRHRTAWYVKIGWCCCRHTSPRRQSPRVVEDLTRCPKQFLEHQERADNWMLRRKALSRNSHNDVEANLKTWNLSRVLGRPNSEPDDHCVRAHETKVSVAQQQQEVGWPTHSETIWDNQERRCSQLQPKTETYFAVRVRTELTPDDPTNKQHQWSLSTQRLDVPMKEHPELRIAWRQDQMLRIHEPGQKCPERKAE